ncbi:MAG: O-acetyl-ADP-ribose deacetylase [Pirellulaceae bacterium]
MSDVHVQIQLVEGDITQLDVHAVVTAANEGLFGGGGVDGAVHAAAGPQLLEACRVVAPCPTGQSRITPGFNLRAEWVIHTVGPVYRDGLSGEPELLASAYFTALDLAAAHGVRSVAFPCISTGVYGYPTNAACDIAIRTVFDWSQGNQWRGAAVFCCFGRADFELYQGRLQDLGLLSEA